MRGNRWRSRTGVVSAVTAIVVVSVGLAVFLPQFLQGRSGSNRPSLPSPPLQFSSLGIVQTQPPADSRVATPRQRKVGGPSSSFAGAVIPPRPARVPTAPIAPREAETSRDAVAIALPEAPPPISARIDAPIERPEPDAPLALSINTNWQTLSAELDFSGAGSARMGTPLGSMAGRDRRLPRTMRTLYLALGGLEAADVQLTLAALDGGAREANPLLHSAASHPAALVGIKAASVVGTIYLVERLRKRHPLAATVTMAAIDAGFVGVVVHNSRVASGGAAGAR